MDADATGVAAYGCYGTSRFIHRRYVPGHRSTLSCSRSTIEGHRSTRPKKYIEVHAPENQGHRSTRPEKYIEVHVRTVFGVGGQGQIEGHRRTRP